MRFVHGAGLVNLGITLKLPLSQCDPSGNGVLMFSLFVQFFAFNQARRLARAAQPDAASLAQTLMQRADACAGRDPRQSAELRDAAKVFLSVTR